MFADNSCNESLFSRELDFLIAIAQAEFFGWDLPGDETSLDTGNEDICQDLSAGLDKLQKNLEGSLRLLNGDVTLSIDTTNEDDIRCALSTLDRVVYLVEYVLQREESDFPQGFYERTMELDRILQTNIPPCHRFLPLNNWRQKMRNGLSEDMLAVLPWYDLYTELDANLLFNIASEDFSIPANQENTIKALEHDIKQDIPLWAHLQEDVFIWNNFIAALQENKAYQLLYLRNNSFRELQQAGPMDEAAVKLGLWVEQHVIYNDKTTITSEGQRIELLYLAAFCGPELDEDRRLTIFQHIENNFSALKKSTTGSVAHFLYQWSKKEISDSDLALSTYKEWGERLKNAAAEILQQKTEMDEYQDGGFIKAVDFVEIEPITVIPEESVSIEPSLESLLLDILKGQIAYKWQVMPHTIFGDDDADYADNIEFPYDKHKVLPMPEEYLLEEEELDSLTKLYEDYQVFYGGFSFENEQWQRISVNKLRSILSKQELGLAEATDIWLAISTQEANLKSFLDYLNDILSKPSTSGFDKIECPANIFWVFYNDENKKDENS